MWKTVGYYNGEMGPLEEMKVPMGDRALYFGDPSPWMTTWTGCTTACGCWRSPSRRTGTG